jgi:hypothetical protein
MLCEALSNQLDNAIKSTPAGGAVRVEGKPVDGRPCLEVRDTGPGVDVGASEKIFRHFFRGVIGVSEGGHGLGLSIAQTVVELHGFTLMVEDNEPGARFIMGASPTERQYKCGAGADDGRLSDRDGDPRRRGRAGAPDARSQGCSESKPGSSDELTICGACAFWRRYKGVMHPMSRAGMPNGWWDHVGVCVKPAGAEHGPGTARLLARDSQRERLRREGCGGDDGGF